MRSKTRTVARLTRALLGGVLTLLATRTASAQQWGLPPGLPPPRAPTEETRLGDSGSGPRARSPRSVKLFDSDRSIFAWQLDVGPLWYRRVQDTTPATERTNFTRGAPLASEIGLGTLYTTPAKPFYLVGHQKTLFRIIDDKSFSWAVFDQELGGGLILGPIEPEARLRLGVLSADIIHAQPSIQLLSPGVAAGIALHVGPFRVGVQGNVDYLWRWFGSDYVVRSLTLGLRLDQPKINPFAPAPGE